MTGDEPQVCIITTIAFPGEFSLRGEGIQPTAVMFRQLFSNRFRCLELKRGLADRSACTVQKGTLPCRKGVCCGRGGPSGLAVLRVSFSATRAMIVKGDLCVDRKAIVFG